MTVVAAAKTTTDTISEQPSCIPAKLIKARSARVVPQAADGQVQKASTEPLQEAATSKKAADMTMRGIQLIRTVQKSFVSRKQALQFALKIQGLQSKQKEILHVMYEANYKAQELGEALDASLLAKKLLESVIEHDDIRYLWASEWAHVEMTLGKDAAADLFVELVKQDTKQRDEWFDTAASVLIGQSNLTRMGRLLREQDPTMLEATDDETALLSFRDCIGECLTLAKKSPFYK